MVEDIISINTDDHCVIDAVHFNPALFTFALFNHPESVCTSQCGCPTTYLQSSNMTTFNSMIGELKQRIYQHYFSWAGMTPTGITGEAKNNNILGEPVTKVEIIDYILCLQEDFQF